MSKTRGLLEREVECEGGRYVFAVEQSGEASAPDASMRPLGSGGSRHCRLELVEAAEVYVGVSASA